MKQHTTKIKEQLTKKFNTKLDPIMNHTCRFLIFLPDSFFNDITMGNSAFEVLPQNTSTGVPVLT